LASNEAEELPDEDFCAFLCSIEDAIFEGALFEGEG
jgi:hypothetical protein